MTTGLQPKARRRRTLQQPGLRLRRQHRRGLRQRQRQLLRRQHDLHGVQHLPNGGGDCDDGDFSQKPGVAERCNNQDYDCDGSTDEGCDDDGDNYCDDNMIYTSSSTCPNGGGDCNDGNSSISPGDSEVCNSVDDDCDGSTDEGSKRRITATPTATPSATRRSRPAPAARRAATSPTTPTATTHPPSLTPEIPRFATTSTTTATVRPTKVATTTATPTATRIWPAARRRPARARAVLARTATTPCSRVKPGATETCNSVDDDCDGSTDEGVTITYYRDSDSDNFGNNAVTTQACSTPAGYGSDNTDCDDTRSSTYPGAPETCNTIDDDCDGSTDEGVETTYYHDFDNDSYGDPGDTETGCSPPANHVTNGLDCRRQRLLAEAGRHRGLQHRGRRLRRLNGRRCHDHLLQGCRQRQLR